MTHEQYIELETAKLAKQAGFDWDTELAYNKGIICERNKNPLSWNDFEGYYAAPTQAVLQRWLREMEQLNIGMGIDSEGYWACFIHSSLAYYRESLKKIIFKHTYEAALEAGLQKCLTLIIEKK